MSGDRTVAKAICAAPGSRRRRDPNNERADDAGAAVESGEFHGQAREERQRVDREREQQPAKKPMPTTLKRRPMTSMVVSP